MSVRYDVCIVGLKCYDLLVGAQTVRYLGGIETHLVALGHALRDLGLKVSFVTFDHGQPEELDVGGIRVLKSYPPKGGLPMIGLLYPRLPRLYRAMRRADASTYVFMGAGTEAWSVGTVKRWLPEPRRSYVLCLASDANVDPTLALLPTRRERWLYRRCLCSVDTIVSQTATQQQRLLAGFGRESTVLGNTIPPKRQGEAKSEEFLRTAPPRVLWLGRIVPVKRLEWLLDVAALCPEVQFDVVGSANRESRYSTELVERAETLPNVTIWGRVDEETLLKLRRNALVLCCTSVLEGFPLTFIEAWSSGLPIVTSFDPDGVVAKQDVGIVADSPENLAAALRSLLEDRSALVNLSRRARAHYEAHHSPSSIGAGFARIICAQAEGSAF